MLRSILIGLDGSESNHSLIDLGLRWSKNLGAEAIGIAVVDEPGIRISQEVLFDRGRQWGWKDPAPLLISGSRQRAEIVLSLFAERCRQENVGWKTLESVGTPYTRILLEAQGSDLIMLGRMTHFEYGHSVDPDETLARVIRDSPRPVVMVPEVLLPGDAVVVAYDSSFHAARALAAFEATGLGRAGHVHIVSVAPDRKDATGHINRAETFLGSHGVDTTAHAVVTAERPGDVILRKARSLGASLIIAGAYGQPFLREFFLGSVTQTLLKRSEVPVFCYH